MLYLSDPIYIERDFSTISGVGTYLSYSVYIKSKGINPLDNSLDTYKHIYQGHIYVMGGKQRIHLNDIITPFLYDHSYIKPQISISQYGDYKGMVKSNFDHPLKNAMIRVTYTTDRLSNIYDEVEILQYYADDQKHDFPAPDIDNEISVFAPRIINLLSLRTKVYPRVPRITNGTNKFWVGACFVCTKYFWNESKMDGEPLITWTGLENPEFTVSKYVTESDCHSQFAWNLTGNDYTRLSTIGGKSFGIAGCRQDNFGIYQVSTDDKIKYTKIGEFDDCPSDFYLIWMDRTGAYQCQPFNKKVIRKENITTTTIINSIEETRPISKTVVNNWTLNSDWLTFDEYRAYESIFTSPYLYLYDYKNDEGYWVNCTNKSWEEKTSKNTTKPFNLTINLESNQSQNIRY